MESNYLATALMILVGVGFALLLTAAAKYLGPRRPNKAKDVPLRVRVGRHRQPARPLRGQVLPGRDPVPGVRHRGRVPVPVGGPLPRALLPGAARRRGLHRRACPSSAWARSWCSWASWSSRWPTSGERAPSVGSNEWDSMISRRPSSRRPSTGPASSRCSSTRSSPPAAAWSSCRSAAPKYDIARFGAEFPRFSPRQADLLIIVGTITERQGPALRRIYEQMCEPKWVIAFGVCASTGGFYQNYSTMPGADQVIPVDVYIPGCPPRPEQVLDGLILLQERIQRGEGHSQITLASEKAGDDVPAPASPPTCRRLRPTAHRRARAKDRHGADRPRPPDGAASRGGEILQTGSQHGNEWARVAARRLARRSRRSCATTRPPRWRCSST